MSLVREVNRLFAAVLIVFGVVALSAAYWAITGPTSILQREDNPRLVASEAAIRRGSIRDRDGVVLAESVVENSTVSRNYPYPETSSVVGYSSLRYGVGGAEAAFNAVLRGDDLAVDLSDQLVQDLLHRPQVGSDIRLTLDLAIQQAMLEAMGDQAGAAVVLSVPDGKLLGLVSTPTFDPNTLDEHWEQLAASPDKPFFNRALQGSYQPGSILQTPLMAAALVANQPLTASTFDATAPVRLEDVELTCALRLPLMELSLRDAYAFACPLPFVRLAEQLGDVPIHEAMSTFRFNDPPVLEGFLPPAPVENIVPVQAVQPGDDLLVKDILGQGNLTVSPFQMAVMAAAIINDGNAPRPYVLQATRLPDAEWQEIQTARPTLPFATERTARQLQDLMRNTVANGAALNAARPGIDIGGHAALAHSGDDTQAWFVGFATLPARQAIAVAVVLENSADPGLAADIGGTILAAAHAVQQP